MMFFAHFVLSILQYFGYLNRMSTSFFRV